MPSESEIQDLRRRLQEESLIELLKRQDGSLSYGPNDRILEFGEDTKDKINRRLIDDYREPIHLSDFTVGYIAALYEIVNETTVEEELDRDDPSGSPVKLEND